MTRLWEGRATTLSGEMANQKRDRKRISKQERQVRQQQARKAEDARKRRRGLGYGVTIAIVVILFGFGVVGGSLRGKGKTADTTPSSVAAGQVSCPKADGSSARQLYFEQAPARCIDATRVYEVTITTTAGKIEAELYPSRAFNAVNNFVFLARYHFYDGLPFHRVLKDTFAQTGDPTAPGITGPGYVFKDDGLPASSSQYVRGAILFAHEATDQNGSQILLVTGNLGSTLNPTFPLFGQVTRGFDVLAKIDQGGAANTATPIIRYSIIGIDVTVQKDKK